MGFIISILCQYSACADQTAVHSAKDNPLIKEFGVLAGYGSTKIEDNPRYETIPMYFRLGIDCDKLGIGYSDVVEKGARDLFHKDFRPAGTTSFLIQPFLSYVPSPDKNMETGIVIALKYEWPLTERFHPYIWNGGGVMYFTQHLHEEATQYAFSPQGGAGFSYFLDKHTAISVEYSYRHFSNANLKLPNDGMNQGFVNMGVTWYF